MTTLTPTQGLAIYTNQNASISSPLSMKEIEQKIQSIDAQQIESIAKRVVATIMDRFKIDVSDSVLTGRVAFDEHKRIVGYETSPGKYDPSSDLMKAALPLVVEQITKAFSTPSEFLEEGIQFEVVAFDWSHTSQRTGILYQVAEEVGKNLIDAKVLELRKAFLDIKHILFQITLRLDTERAQEKSELYFDLRQKLNGVNVGHMGYSLKSFEQNAIDLTL